MATEQKKAGVNGVGALGGGAGDELGQAGLLPESGEGGEVNPGETDENNIGGICRPSSPNCGPET